jgi:hypothetical protein
MRHGLFPFGLYIGDLCQCYALCECPGLEEACEHGAYFFEDDGSKVCEECYALLDDDDGSAA